jgi:polysaccharide deacetylase 2 family uncharacterized protein YibQ
MSAENDSAPSPENPESSAPPTPAPADEPAPKKRARLLVIAFATLLIVLGTGATALNLFGSVEAGDPVVALELTPFRGGADPSGVLAAKSFRDTRESGGNLIADPALIEDSATGPLPRVARDGRMPRAAYARAFEANDKRPRIALVIRGLGVGSSNTALALMQLSPEVNFAFVPFAPELQGDVDKARGAGHEIMLELPMEPFDFPDSDPGPHALLAAASAEENVKRLDWALSRATGYVGVMNLLGGRFMGEEKAIEPILVAVSKRGLLFFDNGASSSSVAITVARHVKAPIATGTMVLDSVQTPNAIDAKLAELETAARQDGYAIGVASAYPVTIARIGDWAANADARGFHLVPVSALAAPPADLASPPPAQKTAAASKK